MTAPREVKVIVTDSDEIISGGEHCYRDPDAARRRSSWMTTNPGVYVLSTPAGDDRFLADGDWWIASDGRQGQHFYGLGGRYVTVARLGDAGPGRYQVRKWHVEPDEDGQVFGDLLASTDNLKTAENYRDELCDPSAYAIVDRETGNGW